MGLAEAAVHMHPSIAALTTELAAFNGQRSEKPTAADRTALLALRRKIIDLAEDPTVRAHEKGETDRVLLYVIGTRLAKMQEDFWERNGQKFSDE